MTANRAYPARLSLSRLGSLRRCVWPLGLFAILLLHACAPKLYARFSFNQANNDIPVAEGNVALPTGESIDINEILKKENKKPEKVAVTRIFGVYLLTAEGFQHVWQLQPAGREEATYTPLTLPNTKTITSPKFSHSTTHNCATLEVTEGTNAVRWQIHASGSIDKTCSDTSTK
ncbi:hypothetical protein L6R29_10010 [Myxococcota bacterium]|nr:hypothetical protein [Myxococcota bacterium]